MPALNGIKPRKDASMVTTNPTQSAGLALSPAPQDSHVYRKALSPTDHRQKPIARP